MSKYFFENIDSETCYTKEHFQNMMKVEVLTEMTVLEAHRMTGEGFFYCKVHYECMEVGSGCGNDCNSYKARNGKSGRCINSGYCYERGEEVTLKLKTK